MAFSASFILFVFLSFSYSCKINSFYQKQNQYEKITINVSKIVNDLPHFWESTGQW